jgi:hypothetical protein
MAEQVKLRLQQAGNRDHRAATTERPAKSSDQEVQ